MTKNPRNLLWLIPVLLFVTSPLWKPALTAFLQPRGIYDPLVVRQPTEQQQSFIMDAITITMSSLGRVEWVVNAKQAFTVKSDKEIGMIDVDALYTGEGKEQTRVTSERGLYNVDKSHLVLIDNVVVDKSSSQQQIYTDLLHFYNDKKLIVTPGAVKIKGPDFTISAGSLEYDLVSNNYDFSNRVICEF